MSYFSLLVFIRSDDINNVAFLYISGADIIVVLFLKKEKKKPYTYLKILIYVKKEDHD